MKKILFICIGLAFVATLGACQKECICKKVSTNYVRDTAMVDSLPNAPYNVAADSTITMYSAGHIYDKHECEYLNNIDSTATRIVKIECSMEKTDKKK